MDYEKKYKEALEIAKKLYEQGTITESLSYVLPELKECEDEKIRKEIIYHIKNCDDTIDEETEKRMLSWLEKQGSQNNTEDEDLLYRFCFYSYKDESNILYLSGLYVNGECRNKGIGTKILEVADEVAKNLNCYAIRLKTKIGSNAERLYRRNGYNTLIKEGNQIWLEKQGEQKLPIEKLPEEMKTIGESLGIDSETYNKIVDECIYGEQKPNYTTLAETGNGGINALVTRELSTNGCGDEQNPADKAEPIVVRDFNSVFSREKVKEIDKRIEKSQKLYNAKLRDAMRKVEDFPMTD